MSLLDRLFLRRENRAETRIAASDPYLAEWFGMNGTTGAYVDPQRASGIATAGACISLISQALAAVPLNVYRRTGNGGRERASDHPLYGVLHDMPNGVMTAFEAREMLIASLLVSGNAYATLEWNGRGQVRALHPLDPGSVAVEKLESGRLRYRVTNRAGGIRVYLQDEILHLRYRLARDGVMGLSPIQLARETFNLALTQQDTAAGLAAKGNRPAGALVFPNMMGQTGKDSALAKLGAKIEADTLTSNVLVLDGGAEWKSFSMTAKDAEFLESRKLTNLDICRIWGVPPTVVGILDHGTYSNVEMESRALVVRCLAPMARRVEQAMNIVLLPTESRKTLFVEHDLAGLMRGDVKQRYEGYRIGREWGWLSPNEIRGWENLPEIEGGDEYLSPLNMTPLDERGAGTGTGQAE
ncbi:MAG: phage portal protein [Hyphomicrobiales bacterium]|nr:phage portal protein [Hyphomicrobiales bacterium]